MTTAAQPIPPENVHVVRQDGSKIPIECVYVGRNPVCGCHRWAAVMVADVDTDTNCELVIGMLPAQTEVVVAVSGLIEL